MVKIEKIKKIIFDNLMYAVQLQSYKYITSRFYNQDNEKWKDKSGFNDSSLWRAYEYIWNCVHLSELFQKVLIFLS
jgi:hypothetical protein